MKKLVCKHCGTPFSKPAGGWKKYCSDRCREKAEYQRKKLRKMHRIVTDGKFMPKTEPTETIPILGYNLAPEEASRLREIIRTQGREAVLDS